MERNTVKYSNTDMLFKNYHDVIILPYRQALVCVLIENLDTESSSEDHEG